MNSEQIMRVMPLILFGLFLILFSSSFLLFVTGIRKDIAPILGLGAVALMMLLWILYPQTMIDFIHSLGESTDDQL